MAGYSGKSLAQKLGIKSGARMVVLNAPAGYWNLIGPPPQGLTMADADLGPVDIVHVFVKDSKTLAQGLAALRERIAPNGMIWVSWPKRSSGVATDLDENAIRAMALSAGLVDVKVCAVDETWSGLKLVIRRRDRSLPP